MEDRGPKNEDRTATAIRRVAIVFDDTLRPETTGTYCRRALQGLVEVQHISPMDLGGIARDGFDLLLRVDDGLDYCLPEALRPAAWWAIDTHLDFDACLTKAREFDFVFAAQRDGAERLRQEGIDSAMWLPLACDPEIHRKHDMPKQYDIAFVGNEFPGERSDLLWLIQRKFLNWFVGQRYFDEMAQTYSASRIVFNRSVRNDINMRVFEALACGSLLITNDLSDNGQTELFRSGLHLETYREADELIDKIRYYVTHDDVRERIAAAGRAEVLAKHTYRHRMETLLKAVEKGVRARVWGPAKTSTVDAATSGAQLSGSQPSALGSQPLPSPRPFALCPQPFRDRSYFDFARPELLALIPESAQRVLDIGCAAGRLGEAIKQRQSAHVTGIELDDVAAEQARNRLDEVVVGNVEGLNSAFASASFDCIICGDILEHLEDAESVLARARSWLSPVGRLVASIPNVRHHSVIRALLDGNWTYESAGLLDRDHVRFFTRREIERVFHEAGFRIDQIQFVPGPGYDEWQQHGRPGQVSVGRLHIGGLTAAEAEEFFVYQFLVVARPEKNGEPPQAGADTARAQQLADSVGNGLCAVPPHRETSTSLCAVPPQNRSSLRNVTEPPPLRRETSTMNGTEAVPYRAARGSSRMHFTQNFITDFDQFDFRGEPFAFVRFGDGERAICEGRRVECQDGWTFDGRPTQFAADLNASLRFNDPCYYIGISDACCDQPAHEWFLKQITAPLHQVTFANIFVNWNYRRFRQLDLSGMVIVSSGSGDFRVPDDLIHGTFDIDGLVDQLLAVDRPILVAAGPASDVIVHKYWLRADPAHRQTIVDVGSAIDERTKGRKTRQYQMPGTRTAELICAW